MKISKASSQLFNSLIIAKIFYFLLVLIGFSIPQGFDQSTTWSLFLMGIPMFISPLAIIGTSRLKSSEELIDRPFLARTIRFVMIVYVVFLAVALLFTIDPSSTIKPTQAVNSLEIALGGYIGLFISEIVSKKTNETV